MSSSRLCALALGLGSLGCQEVVLSVPEEPGVIDHPAAEVPSSTVPEAGVRREIFLVEGFTPPPNPETQGATPANLNATQVLRYRQDSEDPLPARAILIAMPGFLGGGASFDALARALVRRGLDGQPLEVWALDRRSNLLEDLRGMDAAEALSDPAIARGYYFDGHTVGGQPFAGFRPQSSVDFLSEWGLATHAEDLRRIIARIPAEQRQARVFLLGHSLGASFAEAYAAWRFDDGVRGAEELAGIVLIDGALGDTPLSEDDYRNGSQGGLFSNPGLTGIRQTTRYTELPLLGLSTYTITELAALRVRNDPEGVVRDRERDQLLSFLLGLGSIPRVTNEAVLGFGFDDAFTPLSFAAIRLGRSAGGDLAPYESFLGGTLLQPADPDATYRWIDAPVAGERSSVSALSVAMSEGRSNFFEWYFPARLSLDLAAVAGADLPEDGYQASFGLRAFDGALIDAPILAVAAGLVPAPEYEAIRARVAPQVGPGRPQAGASRDQVEGFSVLDAVGFAHLDPLTAQDTPQNPVPGAILDFVRRNTAPGAVLVP